MIELATSSTTTTVTFTGDLDLAMRPQFQEVMARVNSLRRQLLVLDLTDTEFLDSTGAAVLISLADSMQRRGGTAALRGAAERALLALEVCRAPNAVRVDGDSTPPRPGTAVLTTPRPGRLAHAYGPKRLSPNLRVAIPNQPGAPRCAYQNRQCRRSGSQSPPAGWGWSPPPQDARRPPCHTHANSPDPNRAKPRSRPVQTQPAPRSSPLKPPTIRT